MQNKKYSSHKNSNRYDKYEDRKISAKNVIDRFEQNEQDNNSFADLVRIEQNNRHKIQQKELCGHNFNIRLGQVFALIYNLFVIFFVAKLIKNNQSDVAVKIFAINGAVLVIISFLVVIEKKFLYKGKNDKKVKKMQKRITDKV